MASNTKNLVKLQLENKIKFPKSRKTSNQFEDLVKKILQPKIKKRCVVAKMSKHPWIKKKKKRQPFRL
jgi:nucleoside-triphosphatase THEP1